MRAASLLLLFLAATVQAQTTHYIVKLTPDLHRHLLHGEETIEFHHDHGDVQWKKQAGPHISGTTSADGEATLTDEAVNIHLRSSGRHQLHFVYTAAPHRGITWFPDQAGFDTASYCEAWMACDNTAGQADS